MGEKNVFVGQQKIYFDHDYPPVVLQKRKEYSKVKKNAERQEDPIPDSISSKTTRVL